MTEADRKEDKKNARSKEVLHIKFWSADLTSI